MRYVSTEVVIAVGLKGVVLWSEQGSDANVTEYTSTETVIRSTENEIIQQQQAKLETVTME